MAAPRKAKVLIVDDEADIVDVLAGRLEKEGFATARASSGTAAIEAVTAEKPDLVILDVMMPGMNGYEVLARIRKSGVPGVKTLPVVMLTAKATDPDVVKGYKEGADYYVTKPFKMETIVNVARYLAGDLSLDERKRIEKLL